MEKKIEIETGKQQVAAIHSNCRIEQESKKQTQESREAQESGKTLFP